MELGSKDSRRMENSENRFGLVQGEAGLAHPSCTHSHAQKEREANLFSDGVVLFNRSATSFPTEKERTTSFVEGSQPCQLCHSQGFLTGGVSTLAALMNPSMYSILHSTGVCGMCQSDFSGLKSKTHGICHLGELS